MASRIRVTSLIRSKITPCGIAGKVADGAGQRATNISRLLPRPMVTQIVITFGIYGLRTGAVYGAMDMPWAKLVGQIAHAYGK
jgi:hypothetical protein